MISMAINAASISAFSNGQAVATFAKPEHIADAIASCEPQTDADDLSWIELGIAIGSEAFERRPTGAILLTTGIVAEIANEMPSILAQQIADAMDKSEESRLMLRQFVNYLSGAVMARDKELAYILRRDSGIAVLDGAHGDPPRFVADETSVEPFGKDGV